MENASCNISKRNPLGRLDAIKFQQEIECLPPIPLLGTADRSDRGLYRLGRLRAVFQCADGIGAGPRLATIE